MATYQPENSFARGSNAQLEVETYPNPNPVGFEGTNVNKLTEEQNRTVEEQIRIAWEPMGMDELPPIIGFELNVDYNLDLKEYDGTLYTNAGTFDEKWLKESGDGQNVVQRAEVMTAEGAKVASSIHFSVVGGLQEQKISGGTPADAAQAAGEEFHQSGNVSATLEVNMQAANRPDVGHEQSAFMGVNNGTIAYGSGLIGHERASSFSNVLAANSSGFNTAPTNYNAVRNIQRASTDAPEIPASSKGNINYKGNRKGKGKQKAVAEIQASKFAESNTTTISSSSKEKGNPNENEQTVLHLLKDVNLSFTNNLVSSLTTQHPDTAAAREKIDKALQLTGGALEMVTGWAQKSADMVDGKEKFLMQKREKAMGQTEMILKALAEAAEINWEEVGTGEEALNGA
ncbi:hypothetical protein RUND412_000599 [Rhizina undulata]